MSKPGQIAMDADMKYDQTETNRSVEVTDLPCPRCAEWFRLNVIAGEAKSVVPPPFYGTLSEDAAGWWNHFDNYCSFTEKTKIERILGFFTALLRGAAAEWLESLMPPVTKNELHLQFEERFVNQQLVRGVSTAPVRRQNGRPAYWHSTVLRLRLAGQGRPNQERHNTSCLPTNQFDRCHLPNKTGDIVDLLREFGKTIVHLEVRQDNFD
jgi:hypothetical protein